VNFDPSTEYLEAADDARREIEAALERMVLRFELALSVALAEDENDRGLLEEAG
jgi:hypothetical protein